MQVPVARPPLLAIVGPTAVGKSALAIVVCEAFGGEVVTADSRQVYRLMDIGTDKPSPADRARVPHHMIDLVYPDESYTLAMYQDGATAVISEVQARGRLPVVAGGTPLYVKAVLEGWSMPRVEPDPALRARLEAEAREHGARALHERLSRLDPVAAGRILPTNTRRIIRALEVIELTGRPISEQQTRVAPDYDILTIALECERPELYERIDRRVDSQIERGLVEEVRSLVERGFSLELPSISGLGYRQIGDYLRGRATLAEAVQRIKWDTHAFVRHQQNWFRRMSDAVRFDTTQRVPTQAVLSTVEAWYNAAKRPSGGV
ncbi:MAG TPA: tRNA (adenosine(37)-N6)-dimethylallyltransferase MiaA [Chloroflexia bacterium]|nr:tRNA (adenosine(37)-N6)-dimethylallyltransferase MiaA [Chloroflexia bacterium]